MSRRALGGFIIINVVVSLVVAFLALQVWDMLNEDDTSNEPQVPQARQVVITATARPGELPASALEGTIAALENQLAIVGPGSESSTGAPAPTQDDSPLPTPNPSALPQGIPPLNPTALAEVTLPSGIEADGQNDTLPIVNGCETYTV